MQIGAADSRPLNCSDLPLRTPCGLGEELQDRIALSHVRKLFGLKCGPDPKVFFCGNRGVATLLAVSINWPPSNSPCAASGQCGQSVSNPGQRMFRKTGVVALVIGDKAKDAPIHTAVIGVIGILGP